MKGSDIKSIIKSKNNFSWQLLQDVFYNKKTIHLDKNSVIYQKKDETLKEFYKTNHEYLNDESKKFLEAKEKFNSENNDIIKNMTDSEYESSLKNEYENWLNSSNDYLSDFEKKFEENNKNNNFTSDSEDF